MQADYSTFSTRVAFKMIDHLSKVFKPSLTIAACFQDTIEANATIHFVLILEAPMTAGVPILCEKFFPMIKELFTNLKKTNNFQTDYS